MSQPWWQPRPVLRRFVSDLVASSHTYSISAKVQGLSWTMLDYLDLDDTYLAK